LDVLWSINVQKCVNFPPFSSPNQAPCEIFVGMCSTLHPHKILQKTKHKTYNQNCSQIVSKFDFHCHISFEIHFLIVLFQPKSWLLFSLNNSCFQEEAVCGRVCVHMNPQPTLPMGVRYILVISWTIVIWTHCHIMSQSNCEI
jgi:hypothetical protein